MTAGTAAANRCTCSYGGSCDALSYIWKVLEELSAALEVTREHPSH
jgi:hypothetical protein